MNDMRIDVRPARPGDFAAVIVLLTQAGLPTTDLGQASIDDFLVADDTAADQVRTIGAVALERHGNVGLLRSLVVDPAWRGRGVGAALVAAIEQRAREAGLQRMALLTETAADFFRRAGYVVAPRGAAPQSLRASSQFAAVCPASAVYMEKRLGVSSAATVADAQSPPGRALRGGESA